MAEDDGQGPPAGNNASGTTTTGGGETGIREDQVNNAVGFLSHPKVKVERFYQAILAFRRDPSFV